jgi:hypothetical protein
MTALKGVLGKKLLFTRTLPLAKCPHCKIANPNIAQLTEMKIVTDIYNQHQAWQLYYCASCASGIIAGGKYNIERTAMHVNQIHPSPPDDLSEHIPKVAREYLTEARNGLHNSRSSIMASSTSIDAMLRDVLQDKGADGDTLYKRIKNAVKENILSEEMSNWAHQVRLNGNEQRHLEDKSPALKDAQDCLDYAMMLAEILFVIPKRVQAGIDKTKTEETETEEDKTKKGVENDPKS